MFQTKTKFSFLSVPWDYLKDINQVFMSSFCPMHKQPSEQTLISPQLIQYWILLTKSRNILNIPKWYKLEYKKKLFVILSSFKQNYNPPILN